MVENKKPEMRFNEQELSLIRNTFADNDKLLKAIRKVMWQREVSTEEQQMLNEMVKGGDEIEKIVRKFFLPELDGDTPILQMIDLWLSLEFKQMTPEEAEPHFFAREKLIEYLNQQIGILFGKPYAELIEFNYSLKKGNRASDIQVNYINLLFRNSAIVHIDQQLMQIKILANEKQETPEEMMKRISKDSSK